jgi:hypothetical protein
LISPQNGFVIVVGFEGIGRRVVIVILILLVILLLLVILIITLSLGVMKIPQASGWNKQVLHGQSIRMQYMRCRLQ